MIAFEKRIDLLEKLGVYLLSENEVLQDVKQRAVYANSWFTIENIELALKQIVESFLQKKLLEAWAINYPKVITQKKVGIVMAGNIPLVGFHDFLCGFVSGHHLFLKLSSKDDVILKHIIEKFIDWEPGVNELITVSEQIKNCEAYIATGSNNSSRYFEQYFGKYPNIIRKNRTSVAILDGNETEEDLEFLAKDVFLYFGLGCRNVTQVCVPKGYDFESLLRVFNNHEDLMMHHKYKNNFDYYLAIYLLNKVPYLTNNSLLIVENVLPFSAVAVLHYRYYDDMEILANELKNSNEIQTIIGKKFTPFGQAQKPLLNDYADGVDTMNFLCNL